MISKMDLFKISNELEYVKTMDSIFFISVIKMILECYNEIEKFNQSSKLSQIIEILSQHSHPLKGFCLLHINEVKGRNGRYWSKIDQNDILLRTPRFDANGMFI